MNVPGSLLAAVFCPLLLAVAAVAAPGAADRPGLRREDLIGTWRLVSIDYSGPQGPLEDPFYHRDSTGMLTYDGSGTMSVQISAHDRPALSIAATRPAGAAAAPADGPETRAKAAALDSYYAYFGTWELDATGTTVVHHVVAALIPAEAGISYSQGVSIEGGRLVFTNRQAKADGEYVRRKTWEKAGN